MTLRWYGEYCCMDVELHLISALVPLNMISHTLYFNEFYNWVKANLPYIFLFYTFLLRLYPALLLFHTWTTTKYSDLSSILQHLPLIIHTLHIQTSTLSSSESVLPHFSYYLPNLHAFYFLYYLKRLNFDWFTSLYLMGRFSIKHKLPCLTTTLQSLLSPCLR